MKLLIDADILAFKVAFVTENKTEDEARQAVDDYIGNFVDYFWNYLTRDNDVKCFYFLTGKESFRKELDPTYKEHRKDKPKPKHLETIRQHLIDAHKAVVSKNGFEADDCLAYSQAENTVICSIDKDFRQVPGYHFHLDDRTLTYVLPYEGLRSFFTQMLTGDAADNVKGIEGCGPVGAKKILKDCLTADEMYTAVYNEYQMQYGPDAESKMLLNSKLLWLLQKERENPVAERLETK